MKSKEEYDINPETGNYYSNCKICKEQIKLRNDKLLDKNAITIEKDKYLVFSKKGEFPDVVIDTWYDVWDYFASENCEYERAYNFDFEKYENEDEVEIYISIL
jgi:predicted transcriptional regulator YdeE